MAHKAQHDLTSLPMASTTTLPCLLGPHVIGSLAFSQVLDMLLPQDKPLLLLSPWPRVLFSQVCLALFPPFGVFSNYPI